eukprot:scaffold7738_cov133-Cylindrotheca_fusiformis.AAC.12
MSEGPYGRHGFNANAGGYGGGQSYGNAPPAAGGYAAPSYGGQSYGASYSAPSPQGGPAYGSQYGAYGAGSDYLAKEDDNAKGPKSGAKKRGDFSFLMTYGAMARMFGFGILNLKTFKSQRATGVSIKTLQLYSLVFFFRLTSIIRHEGYLPYDKSGDWLYHFIEGMSLIFTCSALWACMGPYKQTYQADLDRFGELNVPPGYGAVYLAVPVLLLAIFVHPNLNADFLSDTAWTYAMYLESTALIPQLFMFQKQASGVVELLTAHFVAALGFGRVMEFFFWIYSYHELANSSGSKLPGYLALFAQFVQLVLMLDFFWYYYLAVKNATPLVLPSHNGMGIV